MKQISCTVQLLDRANLRLKSHCTLQVNPTHSARAIHISPDPDPLENTITWIPSSEIPKARFKKTLQLHPRSAVQCVRLSVMLAWQVCVFVVVLMRPLWPVSSLQSGSSSYGACCSHMELALSGRVAGQERGLHLSAHSTAGVSLPARPPLWDGLQMHPTVLLHHQV